MATGTNSSASKIATIVVLIPLLIAAWYAAPWVLPVWKWQNVDFEQIAKDHAAEGYTKEKLEKEFEMIVWYNPRKKGSTGEDPCPYQIYDCKPPLKSVYPDAIDEVSPSKLLVRVSLVSDQDGGAISPMWIGVIPSERFFKITGHRLPPGILNKPKGRQVVLFKGMSMTKVELNQATIMADQGKILENDDDFEDRFDGHEP